MLYKDLARRIYQELFFENLNFMIKDAKNTHTFILKHRDNLPYNEGTLFMYELAEIIKKEKIDEAERQRRELGEVMINDYEKISSLYNWIKTQNRSVREEIRPSNDKSFTDYLKHLEDKELIDSIIDKLHVLLKDQKGREVAKIIMALERKRYLTVPNKGLNSLYISMNQIFGDLGSSQSINKYYNKRDPNGKTIIPEEEIKAIIDFLP